MSTALQTAGGGGGIERPTSSSLADVIDTILDKGLVIDAYVRLSLVGIELLTIDARVVIAGVDTYLRFAQAVNRLDLSEKGGEGLPDLIGDVQQGGAKKKVHGAAEGVLEAAGEKLKGITGDKKEPEPASKAKKQQEVE
jgi:hypothetical protein